MKVANVITSAGWDHQACIQVVSREQTSSILRPPVYPMELTFNGTPPR